MKKVERKDYLQRKGKESDYVQMSRKKRSGFGDLIYRNKRKEKQIITYLLFTKSLP